MLVWLIADKIHTGMVFPYDWLLESGFIPPAGFGNAQIRHPELGQPDGLHGKRPALAMEVFPRPLHAHAFGHGAHPGELERRRSLSRTNGSGGNSSRATAARISPRFLNDCSRTGPDGRPVVCGTSSWGDGVLLESRHIYFIPRVCNVWTVQAIDTLGGDINPWLALTANGLIRQAEKPPNDFEQIWPGGGIEVNPSIQTAPARRRSHRPPGRLTTAGFSTSSNSSPRSIRSRSNEPIPCSLRNLHKAARCNANGSPRNTGTCSRPCGSSTFA